MTDTDECPECDTELPGMIYLVTRRTSGQTVVSHQGYCSSECVAEGVTDDVMDAMGICHRLSITYISRSKTTF